MTNSEAIKLLLDESIRNGQLTDFDNFIAQAHELGILDSAFFSDLNYQLNYKKKIINVSLLGLAAYFGRNEIVQYLLSFFSNKIDLGLRNADGNTVLHLCILGCHEEDNKFNKHAETIDLLLGYGANIKQKNNDKLASLQFLHSLGIAKPELHSIESWVSNFFETQDTVIQQKVTRISKILKLSLSKQLLEPRNQQLSHAKTSGLTFQELGIFHATQNHQTGKQINFGFGSTDQLQRSFRALCKKHQTELNNFLTASIQDEDELKLTLNIETLTFPLLMTLIYDLTCNEPIIFSLVFAAISATMLFSAAEKWETRLSAESKIPNTEYNHFREKVEIIDEIENHIPFSAVVFK